MQPTSRILVGLAACLMLVLAGVALWRAGPATGLVGPQQTSPSGERSADTGARRTLPEQLGPPAAPPTPQQVQDRWRALIAQRDIAGRSELEQQILAAPTRHLEWLKSELNLPAADPRGNSEAREAAAGLLAKIGTPEAVRALYAAADAAQGTPDAANLWRAFDFVENTAAGPSLVELAIASRGTPAFLALTDAARRCADDALIGSLAREVAQRTERRAALVAETVLLKTEPRRVAPAMRELIPEITAPAALDFASAILAKEGSDASITALIATLEGATGSRRKTLLDGLFRIDSKKALPLLEQLALEYQDQDVRKFCVYALGNYRPEAALPVLERLVRDPRMQSLQRETVFVQQLLIKQQSAAPR